MGELAKALIKRTQARDAECARDFVRRLDNGEPAEEAAKKAGFDPVENRDLIQLLTSLVLRSSTAQP